MSKANILIGLPASGKSTWRKLNCNQLPVLSTDDLVMAMGEKASLPDYNTAWKEFISQAEAQFWASLELMVMNGTDFVVDRTNMSFKSRARLLKIIHSGHEPYEVSAHVFGLKLPIHEWLRRLNSRPGKTIPFATLVSMSSNFDYPMVEEGFHLIYEHE